ncbi:MAG: nodulation protein NfeD [Bacteroidales bacterium]|nr:nodulation protein NfeD [Bacteroidales bacterium]
MAQLFKRIITFSLLFVFCITLLYTQNDSIEGSEENHVYIVYKFNIKEEIAPPIWHKTKKAFKHANEINADRILIHMNTYGGLLDAADSIRTIILQSKIPVYVFIDNNAASAGALISIACDSIYMRSGATIGAATVVNQTGEALPDKYQSYMRAMMRSTAEATGRDPDIAQAMVDPSITIPGISDSGKVLTFTTSEAIENEFCEAMTETVDDVLKEAGIENYEIIELKLTLTDKIIGFLINPMVSGILIMVIVGGIYFELQTPGVGFPIAASALAAVVYFAPLYIEGLANNWEILIFIIGIILLLVEIFAIPGFGVAGISGLILMIAGLSLSMVDNIGFEFSDFQITGLIKAFFIVIIAMFLSIISSFFITRQVFTTTTFGHLALDSIQEVENGYSISDKVYKSMVGKMGIALTILRPAGKVEIENEIFDAVAETSYIEKGEKIEVVKYETSQLFVTKKNG